LPVNEHNSITDVVDAFQLELISTLPVTVNKIAKETEKDTELSPLLQALKSGNKFINLNVFN